MEIGYPTTRNRALLGHKNVINAILLLAVPVPAILTAWILFHWFPENQIPADPGWSRVRTADQLAALLLHHPILAANVFYFIFVNVVFWAIALVQRSSWLIDPYWTLLPILLAWFYVASPLAEPDGSRLALAWSALLVWSCRLTYNYFRRENWRFGLREDWRYAKMREERRQFWWEQFVIVHVAQQAMLVGLTLPFWAVSFRPREVGLLDALCFTSALIGIAIARSADSQLDRFMRDNAARLERGEPRIWLLDSGIWRYSRHPNYFGEQLFWWSMAAFGVVCGEPWVVIGTLLNSCVLASVTVMTEQRMLEIPERRKAYLAYRERTSVWIPWRARPHHAE